MKVVSEKWITNGRTVYTTVTDARSRHPEQRQAVLSIAEGWSDKEAAELCERIVAIPEMIKALEYAYECLSQDDNYVGDPLLAKVYTALVAAKGDPHAPATTD